MPVPPAFLGSFFIRKSVAFAGNTLLLYDYLLTLPLEVSHIWDASWSLVKVLFLVNRYGNLIGQTAVMLEETGYLSRGSPKFCATFQLYTSVFVILSEESIRLLVVMRACATLGFKHKVAMSLNALYALYGLTMIAVSIHLKEVVQYLPAHYLNKTGICFSPVPPFSWGTMLLVLAIDTLVFTIIYRQLLKMTQDAREIQPSHVILSRDALLFYIAATFNVMFTVVCWTVYSEDPRNIIQDTITNPFLTVVGQRLILNLRRPHAQPNLTGEVGQEIDRHITVMVDQQVMYQLDPGDRTMGDRVADPHGRRRASRARRGVEGAYELGVIPRHAVPREPPPFVEVARSRVSREGNRYESSEE